MLLLHSCSSDDSESVAEIKVSLATPTNNAIGLAIKPTLSWSGISSLSGDVLTYDVYLDSNNPPTKMVVTRQSETVYTVSTALETNKTYYWRVSAKNSNGTKTNSLVHSFTTFNTPPTAPVLVVPVNNAKDITIFPTLSWEASTDPEGDSMIYDVYLDTNNPPTTAVSMGQNKTSYAISTALETSKTYYWKVSVKNSNGTEVNSLVGSFTTFNASPTVAILTAPVNNATDITIFPTLSWKASTDPEGDTITYDVYLDTNNPPTIAINIGQNETNYTVSTALERSKTYYWEVIAKDSNDGKTNSLVHSFTTTTVNAPPTVPILKTPEDNVADITVLPTLTWESSTDPERDPITYDIYLDTNNPPTTIINTEQSEASHAISTALNTGTTYYWKILAKDSIGAETNSLVQSFTTTNAPPIAPMLTNPYNNTTDMTVLPTLTWEASTDPEGDLITYDVYLGTDNPPATAVSTGQNDTSHTVDTALNSAETYYWKVVAKDNKGNETTSIVWQFTINDIKWIEVTGGTFTMGCTSEQSNCESVESPTL